MCKWCGTERPVWRQVEVAGGGGGRRLSWKLETFQVSPFTGEPRCRAPRSPPPHIKRRPGTRTGCVCPAWTWRWITNEAQLLQSRADFLTLLSGFSWRERRKRSSLFWFLELIWGSKRFCWSFVLVVYGFSLHKHG